ncbi:PLDc N-terminal domain-containing protein [Aliarcobacter cryaerophilus]|uniref:PLDc N-terminal domain-containing protein n=1 Tax=Aliarcobacter cryaerophilus TaxID=28198 RepID=UPI0021B57A50|nr:PLDc N-terminal domain-containing protein [Aliarcobacter cryaerophilus]MCT7546568.1 PLDc N-terminal domain-containing protein [Aliarcobacter cryaerophilus]
MDSLIGLLILILWLIMPLVMLVNVAISEFKDNTNKIVWIIIILVLYPIGWILYLIFGRKQRVKKGENNEK